MLALLLTGWAKPGLGQTPPEESMDQANEPALTLYPRREAGGMVVGMQDFFRLINNLYSDASGRWDPISGIMRIEAAGHQFDALSRRSMVVLDGKLREVPRPLMLRQGQVLIPLETVQVLLKELGIHFEYQAADPDIPLPKTEIFPTIPPIDDQITTQSSAEMPRIPVNLFDPVEMDRTVGEIDPDIQNDALNVGLAAPVPMDEIESSTPTRTEAVVPPVVLSTEVESSPPEATDTEEALTLQPPRSLAGRIGLTWEQLADLAHRQPPRRITVVCDQLFKPAGELLNEKLQRGRFLEVTQISTPVPRRDQGTLLAEVLASRPQLLVDLMVNPIPTREDAPPHPIMVWVVNEALWPQDRQASTAGDSILQSYRKHQFQSMALGSLLRNEFGRRFPDRLIQYELAPAYLLRRVDAPAAALLIPIGSGSETVVDPDRQEMIARALYEVLVHYLEEMERVKF